MRLDPSAILIGAIMGLLIATLGAGGGLILVPALIFVFHESVASAAGTSLAVITATAGVGALGHWRKDHVRGRVALLFGSASMLGTFFGAWLHVPLAEETILGLFAVLLVFAALRMVVGRTPRAGTAHDPRLRILRLLALGLFVGTLAGLFGVGGGFIIVPCLIWGAGLDLRDAIGTSLAIIALTGIAGSAAHIREGHVSAPLAAMMCAGSTIGALVGAPLSGRLPERPLRIAFAALVASTAVYLLLRALRLL